MSQIYLGEDNALANCEEVVDLNQNLVFGFLVLAVHVELFNALNR